MRSTIRIACLATLLGALLCHGNAFATQADAPPTSVPASMSDITDDPIGLLSRHHYGRREHRIKQQQLIGLAHTHEPIRMQLVGEVVETLHTTDDGITRSQLYIALRELRAVETVAMLEKAWEEERHAENTMRWIDARRQLMQTLATLYTGRARFDFLAGILNDEVESWKARFDAVILLGRLCGEPGAERVGDWLDKHSPSKPQADWTDDQRMAAQALGIYTALLAHEDHTQPPGQEDHEEARRDRRMIVLTQDTYAKETRPGLYADIELSAEGFTLVKMSRQAMIDRRKAHPELALNTKVVTIHRHPDDDATIRQFLRDETVVREGDRVFTFSSSSPGSFRSRWVVFRKVGGRWVPVYFGGGMIS